MHKRLIETASAISLLSLLAFGLPVYAQDAGTEVAPTESGEAASQGEELLDCPPDTTDPACLDQGQSTGGSGDDTSGQSGESMDDASGSSGETTGGSDAGDDSGESGGDSTGSSSGSGG